MNPAKLDSRQAKVAHSQTEGRACPTHKKPYPLREWRGKLVEDNCPDCTRDFLAELRGAAK
jgi:hypothetical protein